MLPFKPEPLTELRKRYPKALETLFDLNQMTAGFQLRPGQIPRQVFDFEGGQRLIISREDQTHTGSRVVLHLSCSINANSKLFNFFRGRVGKVSNDDQMAEFVKLGLEHYVQLSGDKRQPDDFFVTSEKMVPHWYFYEPKPAASE